MAQAWKITRRQGVCSECEGPFADGEAHFSRIRIVGDELLRDDLHTGCFDAPEGQGSGEGSNEKSDEDSEPSPEKAPRAGDRPLFWWRTHHRVDAPKKGLRLDLESLEALFLSLEGREERGVRELRYVLCLLLMRKRRLKVLKVNRSAEGESFTVKRPRRDEKLCVWVYDFEPERMDELRAELIAIFDGSAADAEGETHGAAHDEAPPTDGPGDGGSGDRGSRDGGPGDGGPDAESVGSDGSEAPEEDRLEPVPVETEGSGVDDRA